MPSRAPKTRLICLAAIGLLAACDEPMIRDSDVIRQAADPAYTYGPLGGVIASSCQPSRPSSLSSSPSACQRDMVLARQVTNPSDLVDPVTPGAPAAGPIGRAADAYINGTALPSAAAGVQSGTSTMLYPMMPAGTTTGYGVR